MARIILAFNGDLESRLALHWLVHERGHQVITLSINLGQEMYLEPLGELALELGAVAARVIDRREAFCVISPCRCCRPVRSTSPVVFLVRHWPAI